MKFLTLASLISFSGLALTQGIVPDEAQSPTEASIIRSCVVPNTIAFTIDDGPTVHTPELLAALKDANIKATFFVNCNNLMKDLNGEPTAMVKPYLQDIFNEGHEIGSHTYNHACFTQECQLNNPLMKVMDTKEAFEEQIKKNEDFIFDAIQKYPALYRAPFGDGMNPGQVNATLKQWLYEYGYPYAIHWDIETQDMEFQDQGDEVALQKAQEHYAEKEGKTELITLQHAIPVTINTIIPWIKNVWMPAHPNMRFVKVSECLGLKDEDVYKDAPGPKASVSQPDGNAEIKGEDSSAVTVFNSLMGSIIIISITALLNYF